MVFCELIAVIYQQLMQLVKLLQSPFGIASGVVALPCRACEFHLLSQRSHIMLGQVKPEDSAAEGTAAKLNLRLLGCIFVARCIPHKPCSDGMLRSLG